MYTAAIASSQAPQSYALGAAAVVFDGEIAPPVREEELDLSMRIASLAWLSEDLRGLDDEERNAWMARRLRGIVNGVNPRDRNIVNLALAPLAPKVEKARYSLGRVHQEAWEMSERRHPAVKLFEGKGSGMNLAVVLRHEFSTRHPNFRWKDVEEALRAIEDVFVFLYRGREILTDEARRKLILTAQSAPSLSLRIRFWLEDNPLYQWMVEWANRAPKWVTSLFSE